MDTQTNGTIQTSKKQSSRGRTPQGEPNPIDIHVGKLIRLRREVMSLSQEKVGKLIGISFQKIQKYEHGMNRISASRIYDFSQIFGIPVTYFFDEMDEETAMQSPRRLTVEIPDDFDFVSNIDDPMQKAEAMELIKAFNKISNRKAARALREFIVTLSHSALYEEEVDS